MEETRCYMCGRTPEQVQSLFQRLVDESRESEIAKIDEQASRVSAQMNESTAERYEVALQVAKLAPDLLRTGVSDFMANLEKMKSMYVGTDVIVKLVELTSLEGAANVTIPKGPRGNPMVSRMTIEQIATIAVKQHESVLGSRESIVQRRKGIERKYDDDEAKWIGEAEWISTVSLKLKSLGSSVLKDHVKVPLCLVCSSWKNEIQQAIVW